MATEDPTHEDITHLAEVAARELLETTPTQRDAQPIEWVMTIHRALDAEQSGAARLKAAISDDASFGDLRAGWIQQVGMGMLIQDHVLPSLLINIVVEGHSPKSFVEEARAFAASRMSITESYTALAGVTVAEAVSLGPGMDLIPWNDVPDSAQKEIFGSEMSYQEMASPISLYRSTATSAIRVRSAECQVLFSSNEDAKRVEVSTEEIVARTELNLDVVRCITALSACPVAAIGGWLQFDRTIANRFTGTGYTHGGALFDFAVISASSKPVALDGNSVARLFQQFEKFKSSERGVMRVALDRLNQAIRRPNIVDKAIDLGIALEVMLLHGIGENDRGEMRFRSSIRGATFLGGEKLERKKTFKLLKDAYDLRSKAVHTGVLEPKKNGPPPKPILENATSVLDQKFVLFVVF